MPGLTRPGIPLALRISSITVGVSLGIYLPFTVVILQERGLDATAIGLVLAIAALVQVVAIPFWGQVADTRTGRTRAVALVAVCSAVAVAAIAPPIAPVVTGALVIVATFFVGPIQPLSDAVTVNVWPDPRRYVRLRLLLSLFYAGASLGAGFLYLETGYTAALFLYPAGALVLALVTRLLPDQPLAERTSRDRADAPSGLRARIVARGGTTTVALTHAPALRGILLAIMLVILGHVAGYTFLTLRITELGGSELDVALSATLSAIAEVPAMLVAGWLAERVGLRILFAVSAACSVAAVASWAVSDTVPAILATRPFLGISYAGIVVSGVITMRRLLPAELQGTGQSLFQAVGFGLSAVILNLAGGLLVPRIGDQGLFAVCAALGVVGILVGLRAFRPADPAALRSAG
ncbi:MAG: MFS transporter [Chloroflexota bacterium]